jgi:hypothetical protein
MQKIDKDKILSTNYKDWEDKLTKHPKYSSSHKFIKDIKMNLLHCQKGLCAYTEELLCDLKLISEDNWKNGEYITDLSNENLVNGDLEHFDCTLKEEKAYLWDNLFMVNSNINCRVKGTKRVDNILKPDSADYDPYKYLEFDTDVNKFIANTNLEKDIQNKVNEMIQVLGINRNAFKRAKLIKDLKEDYELGLKIKEPIEYITAWTMTLEQLKAQ